MSYKSMVVHLDNDRRCADRIDIAARLALDFDARLAGLYLLHQPELPTYASAELGAQYLQEKYRAWRRDQIELKTAQFREKTVQAGLEGAEFRVADTGQGDAIALHARYADLLVMGQIDPDVGETLMPRGFAGRTVLSSGRPVLILPYAGTFPRIGTRVLVAWNASREAARAVTDALPFLQRAAKVTVLAVNPGKTNEHGEQPGADISLFLARHGVRVEAAASEAMDIDIGAWLLSRAFDLEADLIVMGGYGHSRLREFAFGGVTRTLLAEMTVPVLMSH